MPAKIDTELNLRFLYICFKHSNFSTVDFHEVASYFQIKAPAARMRLMRLRQALEAESNREGFREKDRKRRLNPFKAKDKMYNHDGEDEDDDEALDDVPLMQRLQARLMRIKREEGLMIKNEDGTLIKDEDGAMIKNEDDGFWGKKEEDVDEQEEKDKAGAAYFKSEVDDSRSQVIPVNKEGVVKPRNVSFPAIQPNALYFGPAKMEIDPQSINYGFGNGQHRPTHPANFRAFGHAKTSTPYVDEQNTNLEPEHINVNNSDYSAPFEGHNSSSRPDTYSLFDSFAQFKPPQSAYGNTRATPPSGHDSSFHLDMFNTALPTPVAPSGVKARLRQEYDESVVDSPMVQDDVEEIASDKYYHSPSARQTFEDRNFV
ncbi:hypothetical protein E4T44_10433 [Aureobasidium sp. EXF-8845]|nr:hypothetical protein E4T44_10433 [Aureobasidium sp. EXF-8845]KAI4828050.1 hypothetical protein E4T45_10311 [Aureobasidium sp. EXF-8846]